MKADFLIVGQGLAGTLLAHFLIERGQLVQIIDDNFTSSSSMAAAGIVNPVTGRKYTKSWMIDDLIPFALETYRILEEKLNEKLVFQRNIIRTLPDIRSENNWFSRFAQEGYENYLEDDPSLGQFEEMITKPFSYGEIRKSFQVKLTSLLEGCRDLWKEMVWSESFDHQRFEVEDDGVTYKGMKFRHLVFSEGFKVKYNPYFNYLPFEGAKGEVLLLRIPGFKPEKILRHKIFFAPIAEDIYWVGSGYAWDLSDIGPTSSEKARLLEIVDDVLKVPYEILDHIAGVRPTSRDRRPIMGTHPQFTRIHLFNGLGTKGSSLGPFWASRMTDYLIDNHTLDPQVDLRRFLSKRAK